GGHGDGTGIDGQTDAWGTRVPLRAAHQSRAARARRSGDVRATRAGTGAGTEGAVEVAPGADQPATAVRVAAAAAAFPGTAAKIAGLPDIVADHATVRALSVELAGIARIELVDLSGDILAAPVQHDKR